MKIDSRLWKEEFGFLVYKGPLNVPIDLPEGVNDCSYMFAGLRFMEGATLRNFRMKGVKSTYGMFEGCALPKSFSFGEEFDLSNVLDARYMFKDSLVPFELTLPSKRDVRTDCRVYGMLDCRRVNRVTLPLFQWRRNNFERELEVFLGDYPIVGSAARMLCRELSSEVSVVLGDTSTQKDVLITYYENSLDDAKVILKELIEDEDTKFSGYTNIRVERVPKKDCWWYQSVD